MYGLLVSYTIKPSFTLKRFESTTYFLGYTMTTLILESEVNSAILELENFIMEMTQDCLKKGWAARVSGNAPSNFKELKKQSLKSKIINVEQAGSENCIYSHALINSCFRFYHDVTHLECGHGFDIHGETIIAETHERHGKEYGLSKLALKVLEAETLGQILYYENHSKFVVNQRAFIDSCLRKGIETAVKFKH